MKPSGRTLLVWGAIIILALTGADSPNSHPSPLQHLTDAAIACAEATQSENIQSAVLERHGWVPHADKLPAGVAQYWRPGVRFGIMVVDAPPQCTAVWSVKSSNG